MSKQNSSVMIHRVDVKKPNTVNTFFVSKSKLTGDGGGLVDVRFDKYDMAKVIVRSFDQVCGNAYLTRDRQKAREFSKQITGGQK